MTADLEHIATSRSYAALVNRFPPRPIRAERALRKTYRVIERLMQVPSPSKDQLDFLELLSTLVEDYESERHPTPTISLPSLLAHLIEAKGVTQADVARETRISPSTISDVLAGRRSLSLQNVKRLAAYFAVNPVLIVDAAVA
jgi:HTH-type transcriptional regulator/antitoxin HigA